MSARTWFDTVRNALLHNAAALALVAGIALPVHGGGPLSLVNQQPVVYPNGGTSLTLNLDQGPLGTRTNAQANAIVQNAIGMWNGVATSTLRLAIGSPLAADYTTANYTNVYQKYSDGLNPIIFDTDGSITDALFGVGAKASTLGFAGSAYYTSGPSAGKYAEGQAVINGSISITDAILREVLAHEIGHFFGLDHAQLDSTQGLATSNYVLMYPIAYRSLPTLHEDDAAAVTSLYPAANVGSTYGQLNGAFTTAAGTPILGANIWARENATGKVYSVVSDFLTQGNGYFRLYLPPGTYTLNAESIASNFTGGSSVGPYSESGSGPSFQSPHPITPVALGGGSAQQIVIAAGCFATATFRVNGTGSVSGNCGGATPSSTTTTLASSANPATAGSNVTLTATVVGVAPTGTVNFKNGGTTITGCGTVALTGSGNSKTAVCSSGTLAVGVHSMVAAYSGDAGNAASTSNTLSQVINIAAPTATTTTLAGSGSPAAAGASVTFTATVAGANPTGTVNFKDGGATINGCSAAALTGAGNSRTAVCGTSSLAVGTHSIVANYSGDAGNAASSSAPLSQVINLTGSAAASFVGTDLVTQGNWKGIYGSEGYAILNDSTNYPAYATVTPSGKADYVWVAQPNTDPRALQRAATGRIAACWYSGSSFNVDVNLTDQATHRVAFYLLDWDTVNRVTRIDVLDASTQQVLSTQTVSSYNQGRYLVWDLRGHVILRFTSLVGFNAVLSGIFFGPATSTPTYSVSGTVSVGSTPLAGVNFAAPGGGTCSASDGTGNYACTVPQGWSGSITPSLNGYSFTPPARNYSSVAGNQTAQDYAATVVAAATTTTLTSSGTPATVGTSVSFTATVTGSNPTGSVSFPADGGAPITGCSAIALTGSGNSKTAVCTTSSLAVGTHSIVANYSGDAGNAASSSAPLSQVINPAGSAAAASFVATDLATQGNWKGRYGSEGYAILNDSTNYPAYAVVTPTGKADYVWAAQPDTDPRAPQRGVATGRIAACWYSGSSFNVDVNLTDQATHRVAFYLLDWDSVNRVTRIDVLDASTQQVLSTQTVSSYNQGKYLVWDLRGHVILRFTNLGGFNAVLSGIFFDSAT